VSGAHRQNTFVRAHTLHAHLCLQNSVAPCTCARVARACALSISRLCANARRSSPISSTHLLGRMEVYDVHPNAHALTRAGIFVLVGYSKFETDFLRAQIPVPMQKRSGFDRDQSAVAHDIKDQLMIAYRRIPDAVSTHSLVCARVTCVQPANCRLHLFETAPENVIFVVQSERKTNNSGDLVSEWKVDDTTLVGVDRARTPTRCAEMPAHTRHPRARLQRGRSDTVPVAGVQCETVNRCVACLPRAHTHSTVLNLLESRTSGASRLVDHRILLLTLYTFVHYAHARRR